MDIDFDSFSRGAKTAMALALRSPRMIKDIVSVDNAPVDAILSSDFPKYVRAMKKIEDANVSSNSAADAILAEVEEVCDYCTSSSQQSSPQSTNKRAPSSHFPSASSS